MVFVTVQPPIWKFPGGVSNFAEDIADAAVREVREETGILAGTFKNFFLKYICLFFFF